MNRLKRINYAAASLDAVLFAQRQCDLQSFPKNILKKFDRKKPNALAFETAAFRSVRTLKARRAFSTKIEKTKDEF